MSQHETPEEELIRLRQKGQILDELLASNPHTCFHVNRIPFLPTSSVGDDSDYESECTSCGAILRQRPNR